VQEKKHTHTTLKIPTTLSMTFSYSTQFPERFTISAECKFIYPATLINLNFTSFLLKFAENK